ncbi:emerin homolog 1-like isoform X2 [Liolophura sinensis]|uniref:emerin homolog 1-like isoform X2 n=1 Tax=Liolophura sinensis TaxID=3198878 RepID=UPI0031594AE1
MPSVRKPEAPAEVQLMSNSELAVELRSRGVDVGPIIATTRRVYERKLAELLQGGPLAHVSSSEDEDEEMEDETYEGEVLESEEPEIVPPSKSSGYQSSIRPRPHIRESYSSQEAVLLLHSHQNL